MKPLLSVQKLKKLKALRAKGSPGEWRKKNFSLGSSFNISITTGLREMDFGDKDAVGAIASVATEHYVFKDASRSGDGHTTQKIPIKTAEDDGELIVEAVNALVPLVDMLLNGQPAQESGWLIEVPADRYGPIRYWSAGEALVVDKHHATRFSRKEDAERVLRWQNVPRGSVAEHVWDM